VASTAARRSAASAALGAGREDEEEAIVTDALALRLGRLL
jgi:hypothetical protein